MLDLYTYSVHIQAWGHTKASQVKSHSLRSLQPEYCENPYHDQTADSVSTRQLWKCPMSLCNKAPLTPPNKTSAGAGGMLQEKI